MQMRDFDDSWMDAQRDGAPDVKVLRDKVVVARQPQELDCGCFINAGERYRAAALIVDGKFETDKSHAYWQECRLNGGEKMQQRFDAEHQRRSEEMGRALNAAQENEE